MSPDYTLDSDLSPTRTTASPNPDLSPARTSPNPDPDLSPTRTTASPYPSLSPDPLHQPGLLLLIRIVYKNKHQS